MKWCADTERSYGQIAHNDDRHKTSVLQLGALSRTGSAFDSSLGIPYKTKERYGLRYLGLYYKASFIVTGPMPIVNSLRPRIAEFLDMSSIERGPGVFGSHVLRWNYASPSSSERVLWRQSFVPVLFWTLRTVWAGPTGSFARESFHNGASP